MRLDQLKRKELVAVARRYGIVGADSLTTSTLIREIQKAKGRRRNYR